MGAMKLKPSFRDQAGLWKSRRSRKGMWVTGQGEPRRQRTSAPGPQCRAVCGEQGCRRGGHSQRGQRPARLRVTSGLAHAGDSWRPGSWGSS